MPGLSPGEHGDNYMNLKDILKEGKNIESLEMTRACQDFLHVVKVEKRIQGV